MRPVETVEKVRFAPPASPRPATECGFPNVFAVAGGACPQCYAQRCRRVDPGLFVECALCRQSGYQKGQFTEPNISMQEMTGKCVKHMVEQKIMPEKQARELMAKHLPTLKRWKNK